MPPTIEHGPVPSIPDALLRGLVAAGADHVALTDGTARLTYGELVNRVAAVAAHVSRTRAGVPICVVAPLGITATCLHLGVMWAGRTCVPLEPSMDPARLHGALAAAGGPVLAADPTIGARLTSSGHDVHVVDPLTMTPHDGDAEHAHPSPDDPALVCFTSGSTAAPRGVIVPHCQIVEPAFLFETTRSDVVSVNSPPSFFASTLQTMLALASGGTALYLDLVRQTPDQVVRLASASGLTHFCGTVTHLRELARAPSVASLGTLRVIDVGGEPLVADDLVLAAEAFPGVTVRHLYGSTEAGRIAHLEWRPGDPIPEGRLPAGRPSAARRITVVDTHGHDLPAGSSGQIAVQRPEPFLGYWADEVGTRVRRLERPDGSWILSGDVGLIDEDGALWVTGRVDDQVKLRGRFVDLAEIDQALEACPEVSAARTVAVPPEAPRRLVAFVVAERHATIEASALRRRLSRDLPLAALPNRIVGLERLPVNERGKVDMAELRRLALADDPITPPPARPALSPLEAAIAGIFAEVLDLGATEPDVDFFDAGGDSLRAVELLEAIHAELGHRLEPGDLVVRPTPAQLAELLESGALPPAPPHPRLAPMYRGSGQTDILWVMPGDEDFGPARAAALLAPDSSFLCVPVGSRRRGRPPLTTTAIAASFVELVEHLPGRRLLIIGFSGGALIAQEMAVQLADRGGPPTLLVLVDAPPGDGPSWGTEFHRPAPAEGRTLLRRAIDAARRSGPRGLALRATAWLRTHGTTVRRNVVARCGLLHRQSVQRRRRDFYMLHSRAGLRHQARPYGGSTLVVTTSEFRARHASALEAALLGPVHRRDVEGNHHDPLTRPAALVAAIRDVDGTVG